MIYCFSSSHKKRRQRKEKEAAKAALRTHRMQHGVGALQESALRVRAAWRVVHTACNLPSSPDELSLEQEKALEKFYDFAHKGTVESPSQVDGNDLVDAYTVDKFETRADMMCCALICVWARQQKALKKQISSNYEGGHFVRPPSMFPRTAPVCVASLGGGPGNDAIGTCFGLR
jgi:hypothetical protein